MEQSINKSVRAHRTGSITAGISLIIWGIAFVLHELCVISDFTTIIKLWPLILVGMGIEILYSNVKEDNIIYDKGAVFIMIVLMGFSVLMAFADVCLGYIHV